ncbi:MAG: RNA methyltransferase [Ruminococcus sp.]|nr:RNA methyltransferase [Ruminococcus sp.]
MKAEIKDLDLPELLPYRCTKENLLRDRGLFIAESPEVIRKALKRGYEPVSLLMDRRHEKGQAADLLPLCGEADIFLASPEQLTALTGFSLTKGVMALMKRKPLPEAGELLSRCERAAVLENITNQTNVGAVFRSAAALGYDCVLLDKTCSDPLFRRSVRVSMGTVFDIPWTYLEGESPAYVETVRSAGFTAAALALREDATPIDDASLREAKKLALLLGTEGTGLRAETISACDKTVIIPMSAGVDSLNVAAAAAVAFYATRK